MEPAPLPQNDAEKDRKAKQSVCDFDGDALREKAIKRAKQTIGPHVDAAVILYTWRDDDDKTQHDAATIGNEHACDSLAETFVEEGCSFDPPDDESWKGKRKRKGNGDGPEPA